MRLFAISTALLLATSLSANAEAQGLKAGNFYGGGGVAFTSAGFGNATGFQVFGGYDLDVIINGDISAAIEVGYLDTGDFDGFGGGNADGAEGIWVNLVNGVKVNNKLDVYTRFGVDFGDDDGFMVGAGMGYKFNQDVALRVEYVTRDHLTGMQFNLLIGL